MSNEGTINNTQLAMWNSPRTNSGSSLDGPTIGSVRQALLDAGLNMNRAEDIPETTAFRRAADGLRGKDCLVRVFNAKDELLAQVDKEVPDGKELERTRIGVWLHKPTGPEQIRGFDYDVNREFRKEYEKAVTHYNWSDVTKILQEILTKDGVGAYSPRSSGGIYFVPTDDQCLGLLDKLDNFYKALGGRLLRYDIPNTEAQRQELSEAISGGLLVEIEGHKKAIDTYTPATRSDTFALRRQLMLQTAVLVGRLGSLINGKASEFGTMLGDFEKRIQELEVQALVASKQGGRRIVSMMQPVQQLQTA